MSRKVVVCGAGFIGSNIAKCLINVKRRPGATTLRCVQLSSRRPERHHAALENAVQHPSRLLPPVALDITKPETFAPSFKDAAFVISLVGLMNGAPKDFEDVQWKGAENVARAAKNVGAKLIHFSAIGADINSSIPYARTKALAEEAVFNICPDATVIRPSIVFGPGDSFFTRFARISRFLPFLPVFGGGHARFQPVYVGDIARAVEIISRDEEAINKLVAGKIMEAGGPDVFTYREIMELVLQYTHRRRPIISLPFAVGMVQGMILEKLPPNLFTLTRAQVNQLKSDNIVNPSPPASHVSFKALVEEHSSKGLTSVQETLNTYLVS